jgi:hypothetical protein
MVIVLFRRVWFSISHVRWTYASGDPVVVWATRWETSIVHWRTYDKVTPSLSLVTTVHLHSLLHPTGCTQTHIRVERLGKETCCWLLKGRQHLIFLCCVGHSTKKPCSFGDGRRGGQIQELLRGCRHKMMQLKIAGNQVLPFWPFTTYPVICHQKRLHVNLFVHIFRLRRQGVW